LLILSADKFHVTIAGAALARIFGDAGFCHLKIALAIFTPLFGRQVSHQRDSLKINPTISKLIFKSFTAPTGRRFRDGYYASISTAIWRGTRYSSPAEGLRIFPHDSARLAPIQDSGAQKLDAPAQWKALSDVAGNGAKRIRSVIFHYHADTPVCAFYQRTRSHLKEMGTPAVGW
jgi:hypothetical protein